MTNSNDTCDIMFTFEWLGISQYYIEFSFLTHLLTEIS